MTLRLGPLAHPISVRAAGEAVALGGSALTFLWIARALGPHHLGLLAIALTVLVFAQAICDFGFPSLGAQAIANYPATARAIWIRVTERRFVLAAPVSAVMLGIGLLAAPGSPGMYLPAASAALLLHPLGRTWFYVAVGRIARAAFVRGASVFVTFVVVVVSVQGPEDADLAGLSLVLPPLIVAVLSMLLPGNPEAVKNSHAEGDELTYKASRHYALADLSLLAYSYSDRLLLLLFVGPGGVGLYDAAHRLIQPFYSISVVVRETFFLHLARTLRQPELDVVLRRFVIFMAAASLPVGPFLWLFAPTLVLVLFGDEFRESAAILAVLGWTISVGFISGIVVLPFLSWNRGPEYGRSLFFGNVASVVVNLAAIPVLGTLGAALGSISSKLAVTLAGWPTFKKASGFPLARALAPFVVASALAMMAGALITLSTLPVTFAMGIFVVTYAAMAFVLVRYESRTNRG